MARGWTPPRAGGWADQGLVNLSRMLLPLFSPGNQRGRLSILIFHQVLSEPDPFRPEALDAVTFDWQIALLAQHFNLLPLPEAIDRLRDGTLPSRAACVTFDDGYADNATVALPILDKYRVPATFFISTGYLDGGRMWHDTVIEAVRLMETDLLDLSDSLGQRFLTGSIHEKRRSTRRLIALLKNLDPMDRDALIQQIIRPVSSRLPTDLMMTSDQVRMMQKSGMVLGCHTVTHPIFTTVSTDTVRQEIQQGRADLQSLLDDSVTLFAYPNGRPFDDYLAEHVALVRELGFDAAFSTASGVATLASDNWQLPRFSPWDRIPARFMARLLQNAADTRSIRVPANP
ncbi:polysaccharide deacetylase family protein [Ectothiorhodospira variabilis]|uniref:polysaccharide deacetylase family protein n=1 Tax=Ectothiorhodospira variabilis TaxID=505694 RepID=UPI001EFB2FD2|nr:polysaccharide deacetylase family protein [Ectothiorhodospira variabilis]MCG5497546.1 polysaccharide deacetylase family protein [Ectothiorhodospira variabilis]